MPGLPAGEGADSAVVVTAQAALRARPQAVGSRRAGLATITAAAAPMGPARWLFRLALFVVDAQLAVRSAKARRLALICRSSMSSQRGRDAGTEGVSLVAQQLVGRCQDGPGR